MISLDTSTAYGAEIFRKTIEETLPGWVLGTLTRESFGAHGFLISRGEAVRLSVEFVWPTRSLKTVHSACEVVVVVVPSSTRVIGYGSGAQSVADHPGAKQFPNLHEALIYLRLKLARGA